MNALQRYRDQLVRREAELINEVLETWEAIGYVDEGLELMERYPDLMKGEEQ